MRIDHERVRRSARAVTDAGVLAESAARLVQPSRSLIGRLGAAAVAAKAGSRLFPAARQLLRRYPLTATLALAAVTYVLYRGRQGRPAARW